MIVVNTVEELRKALDGKKDIALVPTMGNLHEGHLALTAEAKKQAPFVVASIFVNPLQFGPNEDFDTYPRTLDEDIKKLEEQGAVDVVFAPSVKEMYPEKQTYFVKPDPRLANIYEGYYRPGFFDGVATVVSKLFNMVRPSVALFGKKDYQQLKVIEKMVKQMGQPIKIVAVETARDPETGLAYSSRNNYLTEEEKKVAPLLYKVISRVKNDIEDGAPIVAELESDADWRLRDKGWKPDYVVVVRRSDLMVPLRDEYDAKIPMLVLAAAKLGNTRLIDNIEVY
ncbi:MAG: pantoate--beta-alanine ligase [Burkholderiales bacterium]|nr:pantoate--beta-alanine ligase [Burkholderiales bacterium]